MAAVERRFLATGEPRDITSIHPVGLGDGGNLGAGHFAHEGLLKRIVCGTLRQLAADLGPCRRRQDRGLHAAARRAVAADARDRGRTARAPHADRPAHLRRPAPRRRPPEPARERGPRRARDVPAARSCLFFKPFPIDVCFLRGTTADEDGNVTMEQEAIFGEMLSMAQAARRCGGIVVVQVKRMARARHAAGESGQDPRHPRRPRRGRARVSARPTRPNTARPMRASCACRCRTSRRCRSTPAR